MEEGHATGEAGHTCYACNPTTAKKPGGGGGGGSAATAAKKKYNSVGDLIKHCIRDHPNTVIASSPTDDIVQLSSK
jgi:hypothetical protein